MIESIQSFGFGAPWWLLLLLLVPLAAWLQGKRGHAEAIPFSALHIVREIGVPVRRRSGRWLRYLGLLALALGVLAMARPRLDLGSSPAKREGVDIVFCVDVSNSMAKKDFPHKGGKISKREATILAIGDFVDRRPNDRFGMIGFARDTYLLSPLTIDANWIKDVLKEIQLQPWTSIGEGIVSSANLLKDSKSRAKVIVLTSDGANTSGISPTEAAEIAAKSNIRLYAIQFMASTKVRGNNSDSLMAKAASRTGGQYFQTSDLEGMIGIYREIDRMEKTKFEQKQSRLFEELYPWLLLPALGILLIHWIGGNTLWLRVP